jgi:branched-chain amino acid transport system ATP-binding protein
MTLLEIRDLGKRFGGLDAVKDVSLDVEEGRITAVIGPNGAGKSTLFNLVHGFYRPTSGTIRFKGDDITHSSPHATVAEGIARTFQTTNLFDDSTLLENVLAGRIVRSKSNIFDAVFHTPRHRRESRLNEDKAMEALEFCGVAEYRHDLASSVPQEVQKRTAVAMALATGPELLLLDEPAGGIPEEETAGFGNLIRSLPQRGVSVLLVEHKMTMIMGLADTILVLDHGQKLAFGAPAEIQSNPDVIRAYLGSTHRIRQNRRRSDAHSRQCQYRLRCHRRAPRSEHHRAPRASSPSSSARTVREDHSVQDDQRTHARSHGFDRLRESPDSPCPRQRDRQVRHRTLP